MIFRRQRHGENLYIRGLPEGNEGIRTSSITVSILRSSNLLLHTIHYHSTVYSSQLINTLFTMGFFRTLQQKAHEHKSSTITAAKEAEENASYAGSYAALISEYVLLSPI